MITEDIIRQALNESINEFMLEEGEGWNRLKDWYNNGNGKYLKNAVNWGKNAIANYMDKRTNGEWNRKYNVYADNTGKSIRSKNKWDYYRDLYAEQNCLKEWLDSHAEYLNKILHYKEGPMRSMYGRNNFFNTNVFMGISGGTQYIQAYCTYDNFVEYAQRYFTDYQGNEFIEKYINKQIQPLANVPQKCITKLNIRSFSSSQEGDGFYNQSMKDRNKYLDDQKNNIKPTYAVRCVQALDSIEADAENFFTGAYDASFSQTGIDDYFKQAFEKQYALGNKNINNIVSIVYHYVSSVVNSTRGDYDYLKEALTYKEFIDSNDGKSFLRAANNLKQAFSAYAS